MKGFVKKAAAFVFALMMVVSGVACGEKESKSKELDIWLLAGQSNASGRSLIGSYQTYLEEQDARNKEGYADVLYYGVADRALGVERDPVIGTVRMGQGADLSYIGPELGMANVFADAAAYKKKNVAIVKFAASGTSLADVTSDTNAKLYGNWASPSILAKAGVKASEELSGKMFEGFEETVENALDYYTQAGYEPTIRGLVWSQGEGDAGYYNATKEYAENIALFFTDVRASIGELTSEQEGKDMTVVIAKIAPTYNGGTALVNRVREAQQTYIDVTENTVGLETEQFIIVNEDKTINGSDRYHYNARDTYEIGKLLAGLCLESL